MTLVVSVITKEAILQASDRRFVWLAQDGTAVRRDDESNKAVLYAHRMMFAFTGLAAMGPRRQKTDEWIADVLSPVEGQAEALEAIRQAATDRFRHPLIAKLPDEMRGHEFVVAGWTRFPPAHDHFEPYLAVISNVRGDNGEWVAPRDEFRTDLRRLTGDDAGAWIPAGQSLDVEATAVLQEGIDGYARGAFTLLGLGEALVGSIRSAASRNQMIGEGVMLNCLPLKAIERHRDSGQMFMIASGPMDTDATFLSVRPGDKEAVLVGPIVVPGGNRGILSNFITEPLNPGDLPDLPNVGAGGGD